MAWAVTVLARREVLTACSEEGALGNEGRVGGERRKEFLRMPFGRWVGEEKCMVGETWVMFAVGEQEAANKKSPSNQYCMLSRAIAMKTRQGLCLDGY